MQLIENTSTTRITCKKKKKKFSSMVSMDVTLQFPSILTPSTLPDLYTHYIFIYICMSANSTEYKMIGGIDFL